jgi:uncharacterized protein with HEPN domain
LIATYVKAGEEYFSTDEKTQDAVVHRLHTLSEPATRLSPSLKALHELDWDGIAGFRNVAVHGYMEIDLDLIWVVVNRDLPILESAARAMLDQVLKE